MNRHVRPRRARLVAAWATIALLAAGCTVVNLGSHDPNGAEGNGASGHTSLEKTGKYMVFQSDASNLVAGDTNGVMDVFKVDLTNGHVERPSVASDGTQGNGPSRNPQIDCCGGLIVFESDASNLVPGDTNGTTDVFVHNQTTKKTMLISVASNGGPANGPSTHPTISTDGKWIAFESTASNIVPGISGHQVYVRAWQTNATTQLASLASCVSGTATVGNGVSTRPRLSGDGAIVAFTSTSTNFSVNPNNLAPNAYAALTTGCSAFNVPSLVGYDASGQIPPHGSIATSTVHNGRFVAFDTYADACPGPCSIAGVFVRDRTNATSTAIRAGDTAAAGGCLNDDGSAIAIQATGPNGVTPIAAVVDVGTGATRVISSDAAGHARAIEPVTDPAADGPSLARFTGYFAYAAAGGSNIPQVYRQST
jgi:hypothetical protein